MKNTFTLFLLIISNLSFSQKHLDATIIRDNNDTIKSKLQIRNILFNEKLIDELVFTKH